MSDIVSDGKGMNDIDKDGINVLLYLTELADDKESLEITTIIDETSTSSMATSGENWLWKLFGLLARISEIGDVDGSS